MIYKFLENITRIAKIGYIREIPESAIFYKAREDDYGGVIITKINIDYEKYQRPYSNKNAQIELSTDGYKFWEQYNKYIESIDSY